MTTRPTQISKKFIIRRFSSTQDGSFGVLFEGGIPFAVTVEPEWRDNQKGISCIPPGMYRCKRVTSPKFGVTFEITNVEGRDHVLFHGGNTEDDTLACVVVAEKFGSLKGKTAVLESKTSPDEGFNEFLKRTEGLDEFPLEIMGV